MTSPLINKDAALDKALDHVWGAALDAVAMRDELEEGADYEKAYQNKKNYHYKIAKQQIIDLINREVVAARQELAIEFIEQLDVANVPQDVQIPTLVGDDLSRVSVPIVSGEYWINVHKALKYMREATYAELNQRKAGDE